MNKTFKLYATILGLVIAGLAFLELSKTEVTDWRKSYDVDSRSPFGLYVFSQEANTLMKGQLKKLPKTPYDYYNKEKKQPHNILIINQYIDETSWKKILEQVSQGSDLLYISEELPYLLQDSLKLYKARVFFEDTQVLTFTDAQLKKRYLQLDKQPSGMGFPRLNKNAEILSVGMAPQNKNTAVFVKIKWGKGHLYLHTEPLFLTNYYLLYPRKGNAYLEGVFSYLPDRETIWFVEKERERTSDSPLRFVLSHPPLKYAWWIFLGGLLLFAVFNAKRKQRIVPIIQPPKNQSAEFVKSVGNLYLQEGDFHDMMAKKTQYFLYKVRTELLMDTQTLDEHFVKKLHIKTNVPLTTIQEAVELMKKSLNPHSQVMQEDLTRLHRLLDSIYK